MVWMLGNDTFEVGVGDKFLRLEFLNFEVMVFGKLEVRILKFILKAEISQSSLQSAKCHG
jgi:hypothetical protein